jgi:hypothetical protein
MKKRSVIAAALLASGLAAFGLAEAGFAAQAGGMTTLLDGTNMNNFTPVGDANWRVAEGAVQADKGMGGFLVSKNSYGNFYLRAEVWVDGPANSGIFIRCADPAKPGAMACYEVNIFDTRPEKEYGTGAIVNVAKVNPMPIAANKWNVLEIEANGPVFNITFNGQKTVVNARDTKHAAGPFALQYGAGVVKFRKVEIRPL